VGNRLDEVTIVGGGSAGWLIALSLVTMLNRGGNNKPVKITVIESPSIPNIGVGEATVTGMYRLLKQLRIDEAEFMRASDATFKCAGRFENWSLDDKGRPITFYNPFNDGNYLNGIESTYHYHRFGPRNGCDSYSDCVLPTAALIDAIRGPKKIGMGNYETILPYTYHLNAQSFSVHLRDVAIERGVEYVQDDMLEVEQDDNGYISALHLKERGRFPVKFVFDCTGFRGQILQQVLKEPFIPYDRHLLCDRAIPVMIPHADVNKIRPCTTATALSAGWSWNVPLYHRAGTGYVYSSQFISDEEAYDELFRHLGDVKPLNEPRVIPMRIGRVRRPWVKNCIAAGLAAGFVEPLEATAIYSIEMTARWFMTYFPDNALDPVWAKRFNKTMDRQYEDILNFIVMNYVTSNRPEPFWEASRNGIDIPDRLRENLELWEHTMPAAYDTDDAFLFTHWNYLFIMLQKGFYNGRQLPAESLITEKPWIDYTQKMARAKLAMIADLPNHYELLTAMRGGKDPGESHISLGATSNSAALARG
jgi:tryptophan halogenase